jgi:hypothetical protein
MSLNVCEKKRKKRHKKTLVYTPDETNNVTVR